MDKTLEKCYEPMTRTRTRRTHKKSRHGCLGCKQRRKKCDETTPRCSRCMEANITCEYPKRKKEPRLITNIFRPTAITHPSLVSTKTPASRCGCVRHQLPLTVSLSPVEVDLLSHYLTHTAQAIAFDNQDLYALQVGIPNLAFRNKSLLNSIMALAAVCKCRDIINSTQAASFEDQSNIRRLLDLGDARHRASLRQTQEDMLNTSYYDCVLANAPLMVLYTFASHSIRIRLAQLLGGKGSLPHDFVPEQWQWMSLTRAAHLAYTGSLDAQMDMSKNISETWPTSLVTCLPLSEQNEDNCSKDGPTSETRRLILPIIRVTSVSALKRLSLRAQVIRENVIDDMQPLADGCMKALEVLHNIMDQVFNDVDSSPPTTAKKHSVPRSDFNEVQDSGVSPWLRSYLARVTSATQPKPLRRIITSFLNRIPAEYLSLVQSTLDNDAGQAFGQESDFAGWFSNDQTRELAIDIFAHWLVLMVLLDGVWWIGETGTWELKRVISLVHRHGWFEEVEESWWPESMHRIVTESKKYI